MPAIEGLADNEGFAIARRGQLENERESVLSLSLRACHPL